MSLYYVVCFGIIVSEKCNVFASVIMFFRYMKIAHCLLAGVHSRVHRVENSRTEGSARLKRRTSPCLIDSRQLITRYFAVRARVSKRSQDESNTSKGIKAMQCGVQRSLLEFVVPNCVKTTSVLQEFGDIQEGGAGEDVQAMDSGGDASVSRFVDLLQLLPPVPPLASLPQLPSVMPVPPPTPTGNCGSPSLSGDELIGELGHICQLHVQSNQGISQKRLRISGKKSDYRTVLAGA